MNKTLSALRFVALHWATALLAISRLEGSSPRVGVIPAAKAKQAQPDNAYGQIPLSFEVNRGQADKSVDFLARGPGYTLLLKAGHAALRLKNPANSATLRMRVVGAEAGARAEEVEELAGKVNYFIGNDPAQWRRDIPTYGRVRYRQVYRGIDLVYYGNQRQLEYDFVVAPGADWRQISLAFESAEKIEIESATGDLLLHVGGEIIRQAKPIVYQEVEGERRMVEGSYRMRKNRRVGFAIGEHDKNQPLVIDPVLVYSTFLGGSQGDSVSDIAVDSSGNAYLTGGTSSTDFPVASAIQGTKSGLSDVFITKINASGSALVYSTYLGGSGSDSGSGIALDSAGNAYITGNTGSTNFPTANPIQSANANTNGTSDVFVTKLNAAGSALVYSTYLGGTSDDNGEAIAVDSGGNAYLTGFTNSANFPTANPFSGPNATILTKSDAFLTKINAAGSALVYSTYLGGAESDSASSITVDSDGSPYVIGATGSADFPVTPNVIQSTFAGGFFDAFVAKFNAAGSGLVYCTYLGGNNQDSGKGIALDSANNAYVTGRTKSSNFPTVNPIQAYGGLDDIFVSKINPAGSALVYSTYIGGTFDDRVNDIAVDPSGSAYVTGDTTSTNFPLAHAFQNAISGPTDAFVTKLNGSGSALVYSTYLGGSATEIGQAIALDSGGNTYVAGSTGSTDFPMAAPLQGTLAGNPDGFITKIGEGDPPAQLLNISTRLRVQTGDNALIGGFILTGTDPKRVIVRAIGPSLGASGVQGALADTTLELRDGSGQLLAQNDNWRTGGQEAEIIATTIPPANDLESAIVATLPANNAGYTAIVRGTNDTTGIGLVEIYDLGQGANSQLANISTRGFVETGDNALIGGFILGGGGGANSQVVRAIGPSLGAAGVAGALADPTLELKDGNGSTVLSNDDWQQTQAAEINATGLAPTNIHESALLIALPLGSYTAIVRGVGNTTGVGLVEVYNLQ
jgi:hypothetical protein